MLISILLASVRSLPQPLQPVPIQQVHINDAFWAPKIKVWREVTIPDCLNKFEKDGTLSNFDKVATGVGGDHGGAPWFDGLIYEMITGASDFLAQKRDTALEARLDGYIDRIAAAQAKDPNGYLNTYTELKEPDHRWGQNGGNDRWQHDLYNAGALVEAGIHYYRATGKTKLLEVATRMANLMVATMGPAPKQNIIPGHALGEKSLTNLYELYRDQPQLKSRIGVPVDGLSYLTLAKFWIDARGHHEGRTDFGAYDQDAIPVLQQETIEGHAVRAVLLCGGLAEYSIAAGPNPYQDEAQKLWKNMVERRMYVTGAVGVTPDDEKFGPDFDLPNNGYAETCASVGAAFFHEQMDLLFQDSKYADQMERALYNGVLCGVSSAGNRYFYENPLVAGKNRTRWEWHGCPCCPPMFLKAMGALPSMIYAQGPNSLYANLYVGSDAQIKLHETNVRFKQITNYPWNGKVTIAADPEKPVEFDLNLRIPAWCKTPHISLNGHSINGPIVRGYAQLDRVWQKGDRVDLDFPMPAERIHADPRVEADQGRVALQRGPIVYCLEGIDNHDQLSSLVVDPKTPLKPIEAKNFLGGATLIGGQAERVEGDKLSKEPFLAIPYYLNANRAPSEMAVWMAETPKLAKAGVPLTVASTAHASASHLNPSDTLSGLNDRSNPTSSDDSSIPRFTWWDHRGTTEWVQYDFDHPTKVSSVEAYWWDERRIKANCRVPQSWRLLYKDGDQWKPVEGNPRYGTEMDKFNRVDFNPVITKSLRLEAQLQPNWSAGLLKLLVN